MNTYTDELVRDQLTHQYNADTNQYQLTHELHTDTEPPYKVRIAQNGGQVIQIRQRLQNHSNS